MQGVSRGFNTTTGYFINCKSLSLLPESPPSFTQAGKHEFNEFCWSLGFRYFDARNQNSNSVLQSSTVGRFAKQIYFNLFTWSLADQSWVQNNIISGQIVICFQYILICMKYIQKYISATWWCYHSQTYKTRNVSLFLDAPASFAPTRVSRLVRIMSAVRERQKMTIADEGVG